MGHLLYTVYCVFTGTAWMICVLQGRLMNVQKARLEMVHPHVARNFDPHIDPMTASLSFKNGGYYKIMS